MSYQEQYQKAKEAGQTEEVTTSIFRFEEEGQHLIGKLVDISPFAGGDFETDVNQYTLDTDNGRVSCILGSAADKQLTQQDIIGKLVCITYYGKVSLSDGRRVNRFSVEVF